MFIVQLIFQVFLFQYNELIAVVRRRPDVVEKSTILASQRKVELNHWWLLNNRKDIAEFLLPYKDLSDIKSAASTFAVSVCSVLVLVHTFLNRRCNF